MGTCKIVEWCDNAKCVNGCLAQKAVEAEREDCAKLAESFIWFEHENCSPDGGNEFIARLIRQRSNR